MKLVTKEYTACEYISNSSRDVTIQFFLFLQALLPTRRFFNTLVDDHHVVVSVILSTQHDYLFLTL